MGKVPQLSLLTRLKCVHGQIPWSSRCSYNSQPHFLPFLLQVTCSYVHTIKCGHILKCHTKLEPIRLWYLPGIIFLFHVWTGASAKECWSITRASVCYHNITSGPQLVTVIGPSKIPLCYLDIWDQAFWQISFVDNTGRQGWPRHLKIM